MYLKPRVTKHMKNSSCKQIYCKASSNEENNAFVGIRIKKDSVEFCYPESYNIKGLDEDKRNVVDINLLRSDIIEILQTISLAKTRSSASQLTENGVSYTNNFSLISYLWIIRDYFSNGLYTNKEKLYRNNAKGRVCWKKTLDTQPIISNGNIIYNNLVVEVKNDCDTIITDAHKLCIYDSVRKMGWLFGISEKAYQVPSPTKSMLKRYINSIKQEMTRTFDDVKKIRLVHMLKVLSGVDDSKYISEIVYGVDKYHYIYERMVDAIFGNVTDIKKYNPNADWNIMKSASTYSIKPASSLRPDTLRMEPHPSTCLYNGKTRTAYVLDAKFYRYGTTGLTKDLPETTSIQKQVTYGKNIIFNFTNEDNVGKVRNAFILPYNKSNHPFTHFEEIEPDRNLIYIGFAKAKWINENTSINGDDGIVHAFLLDTKHLISSWAHGNCQTDIDNLIKDIEKYYKSDKSWTIVSEKD